jgi:hypothetical protein
VRANDFEQLRQYWRLEMHIARLKLAAVALIAGVSLGGCAYDMYGDPYGYGGYGYGYPAGGLSVGIGYGGYGGYYGYPYGGYDPFGWYGDYYYPGSGIYVYDSYRNRHVWNDDQRRYWQNRRSTWQNRTGSTWSGRDNWSGWNRNRGGSTSSTTTTGTTTTSGWHHRHHD